MLSADQQACWRCNFNKGHMQAKESVQRRFVLMQPQRESVRLIKDSHRDAIESSE